MPKIAQYKNTQYGYVSVDEVNDFLEAEGRYIRISEPLEVEFIPLPASVTVPQEVAVLEKAKEAAQVEYLKVVNGLDEKISKLMAIEYKE